MTDLRPAQSLAAAGRDPLASGTAGAVAPLLCSMVSICAGSSIGKSLFPVAGPAGVTALRVGLAAAMMAAAWRPWRWRLDRAQLAAALRYGVVLGTMNLCFYAALARLPIGVAIAIEFTGPLALAIWLAPRRRDLWWIGLAAAGVATMTLPGGGGGALDPVGVGFALAAAICWALYILAGERLSRLVGPVQGVCLGLCAAALITVPVGIVSAGAALGRPRVLLTGAVVALLCSAVPYPLELVALRRLPRHVFGVVMSLEPAIGALAALLILGERLSVLRWVAIAAVVLASCGVTLTRAGERVAPVG